jgi:hypothetical protein
VTATFTRWLELREPADAAARSGRLAERLARHLGEGPLVIHDLGGGSGSMGRWLAPRLPQPQHWVVHDRDEELLALAVEHPPPGVTVEARCSDITRLAPEDLDGASVAVASALLDMLTADELARMLAACGGLPLLVAMTVTGRVAFEPADPLDAPLSAAFNEHQRRDGRLGPDAVAAVGGDPIVRRTPWRLTHGELFELWFGGWVDAACEQAPEIAAGGYRERRLAQAAAGELVATVDHADLLVLP